MDKKELFDTLDAIYEKLVLNLSDIEAMKKQVDTLLEENATLRLENEKLRSRLIQLEEENPKNISTHGKSYIEGIYLEGFHICNGMYGQRRENNEECLMCDEVLYRE